MIFRKSIITLLVLAAFATLFVVGCDNRNSTSGEYSVEILVPENMDTENITIYADNNITVATIQARVKDSKGNAPMGVTVTFRTTIGSIINEVVTDSSGLAQATLRDFGYKGRATVTAEVKGGSHSIFVDIIDAPAVDSIRVVTSTNLDVSKTTQVSAYPKDADGLNIQDGTIVTFKTDLGNFQLDDGTDVGQSAQVEASNGVAKTIFNAGEKTGIANVTVQVDTLISYNQIIVNPGNPNKINLIPEQTNLVIGGNDVSLMRTDIVAEVLDRFDNPVDNGINVSFKAYRMEGEQEISMGSITGMMATDDNGSVTNRFSVGTQAGVVTIQAVADSALAETALTIRASQLSSIQYDFQDEVDLNTQGTGGVEQFELVVNLYDSFGNLLDVPTEMYFRFAQNQPIPTGCRLGTNVTDHNSYLSVTAYNGQARATVSSGSGSGTVYIQVSNSSDPNDAAAITATKSNIVINGGLPSYINIAIGDYNSAADIGGGLWELEVNANVTDQYGNPVAMGTAVWFSIGPALSDPNGTEPNWAVINAAAFVGNINAEEDSTAGVAYTKLVYDGSYANQFLTISAECGTVTETTEFRMPMNEPQLVMYPQLGHVDFGGPWGSDAPTDGSPDTVSSHIVYEVSDQQGNYVKDAYVSSWSDRGTFAFYVDGNGDTPYKVDGSFDPRFMKTPITGIGVNKIIFELRECPPPQNGVPGEQNVQINAQIEGTDITNNANILIIRYRE